MGGRRLVLPIIACLLVTAAAHAQELEVPDTSPYARLGELDRAMVDDALQSLGLQPEHAPGDRPICEVRTVQRDIIVPEDPFPLWLNVFHRTTRERTIARALTLAPGDTFDEITYRDAERQLRDPSIYSVVAVVPTVAADPGCVDVLVVTRDVWSLRPTWFIATAGVVTNLHLGLVETNLLGLNHQLSAGFDLGIGSWEIGPTFYGQRMFGGDIDVWDSFDLIFDRERGQLEGSRNTLSIASPLRDTTARRGWALTLAHDHRIERRYNAATLRTFDDPATAEDDAVDQRWRQTDISMQASVTRAWGTRFRHLLTGIAGLSLREVEPLPYAEVDAAVLDAFVDAVLPRAERSIGPGVRWTGYENRHMSVRGYDTWGFAEEVRLGGYVEAQVTTSEPGLGASVRFARPRGQVLYRLRMGSDGFVSASLSQSVRIGGDDGVDVTDAVTTGLVNLVTPSVLAGRVVVRGLARRVSENDDNVLSLLGADAGLRGYVAGALQGENVAMTNVEWRSAYVTILSTYVGMAVFTDGAAAWAEDGEPQWYPSMGVGLRWVIPQVGTQVRALDVGFPLRDGQDLRLFGRQTSIPRPVVSITLGQAF